MRRESVASGIPWKDVMGYSRAVCVGPFVYVSGTIATGKDGGIVGSGDPYARAVQVEERQGGAAEGGGRAFGRSTDQDLRDEHRGLRGGRAHDEFFRQRLAMTLHHADSLFGMVRS